MFCSLSFKNIDCHWLKSRLFDPVQFDENAAKHQNVTKQQNKQKKQQNNNK